MYRKSHAYINIHKLHMYNICMLLCVYVYVFSGSITIIIIIIIIIIIKISMEDLMVCDTSPGAQVYEVCVCFCLADGSLLWCVMCMPVYSLFSNHTIVNTTRTYAVHVYILFNRLMLGDACLHQRCVYRYLRILPTL